MAGVTLIAGIAMLNAVANAPTLLLFSVALATMAAMDAITDISMNGHGLRVQKLYGRTILNSFHGWWSIGAVCGGILGSIAAQIGMALWLQALFATVVFGAMAVFARTLLLPGKDQAPVDEEAAAEVRPQRRLPASLWVRLIALGLLGASVGLVEESAASWGAIYMDGMFSVIPFVAGLAQAGLGQAVVPVQHVGRVGGQKIEHDVVAMRMQHVEPGLATQRCKHLEVEAAAEVLVLRHAQQPVRRQLGGEEDAVGAVVEQAGDGERGGRDPRFEEFGGVEAPTVVTFHGFRGCRCSGRCARRCR